MLTHLALATAKAHLANRPDFKPCHGMKPPESEAPDAVPSLANSRVVFLGFQDISGNAKLPLTNRTRNNNYDFCSSKILFNYNPIKI